MNPGTRCFGRFYVHREFFLDLRPDQGTNLFDGMVVMRAREDFTRDQVEYVAIHRQFRPVPFGQVVPEYVATFDCHSARPTWTEKS